MFHPSAVKGMKFVVPGMCIVHQLLAGRDFALARLAAPGSARRAVFQTAAQMRNYVYCVVDERSGAACLVDACWDVDGIILALRARGILPEDITASVYTHHHFDHTGGRIPKVMTGGREVIVDGMVEVLAALPCVEVVGIGALDARQAAKQCGVPTEAIWQIFDDEVVWRSNGCEIRSWNTPGHTAGSISLLCKDTKTSEPSIAVITGDTLFIGSCGRFDLPDSNAEDLLRSLSRLSTLPEASLVYPGHNYSTSSHSTIGEESSTNAMMMEAVRFAARESNPQPHVLEKHSVSSLPEYVPLPAYLSAAKSMHAAWKNCTGHETNASSQCCSCCFDASSYGFGTADGSGCAKSSTSRI